MNVILGVFGQTNFHSSVRQYHGMTYPFDVRWCESTMGYLEVVQMACVRAQAVYFNIEGVHLPIDRRYHTGDELAFICSDPEILEKTVFLLGCEPIDKDTILKLIDDDRLKGRLDTIYTIYTANKPRPIRTSADW